MQNEWWMRPALQKSEAVLLPALPRNSTPRFSDYFVHTRLSEEPFRPVTDGWPEQSSAPSTALSTYVRPRGSMAGRSVLKAAGVSMHPYRRNAHTSSRGCRLPRSLRTF